MLCSSVSLQITNAVLYLGFFFGEKSFETRNLKTPYLVYFEKKMHILSIRCFNSEFDSFFILQCDAPG